MALCGNDCCGECSRLAECGGCEKVDGHPFGGNCIAAQCVKKGGKDAMDKLKSSLIQEINALEISELVVDDLYLLNGAYVNLEYKLSNNTAVRFLNDNDVYWGNQIERAGLERCLGVVADEEFIIVCEYGCNGADPKLLLYKHR